jgi:HSP20 family protein
LSALFWKNKRQKTEGGMKMKDIKNIFEEMRRMEEEMNKIFNSTHGFDRTNKMPMIEENKESKNAEEKENLPVQPVKSTQSIHSMPRHRIPVCHIAETETKVIAAIELPGIDKKDIELNITDNYIELKTQAKKEQKLEEMKKNQHSYTVSSFQYHARTAFPVSVDAEKAEAEYNNGMLRIEIPKKDSGRNTRRLEIK